MPLRPPFVAVIACALLCACVVVPVTVADYDTGCQVVTHHMELQAVQVGAIASCNNQSCAALVIAAAGVTAASAIISGSIVVIGNAAYWAEHRAGCVAPRP
jgi:predicted small integral membrane protein